MMYFLPCNIRPARRIRPAYAGIGLLLVLLCAAPVHAQAQMEQIGQTGQFGRLNDTQSNAGTYFFFTQPGAATIQVQVLGTVRAPGLYEVSEGTTLGQLLALSGGPPLSARSRGTDVSAIVRLYRPQSSGQALIYEGPLEQGIENPVQYPMLLNNDVLMIEVIQRQRFNWRDASRIISTVAVLALAAERISRVAN